VRVCIKLKPLLKKVFFVAKCEQFKINKLRILMKGSSHIGNGFNSHAIKNLAYL
jgi:hypothetical protein